MAKDKNIEKTENTKSGSKVLPGLIFLIGLALIVGGFLLQIGYFGSLDENPTPEKQNTSNTTSSDDATTSDVDEDSTADASDVDFSITTFGDNEWVNVKEGITYTYTAGFSMLVTSFNVNCEGDKCGIDGDKVVLKFSTAAGSDYEVSLTPAEPIQNLIDVPVSIEEWHKDYVVIKLTR